MPSSEGGERMSRRHFSRKAVETAAAFVIGSAMAPGDAVAAPPAAPPDDPALDRAVASVLATAPYLPKEDVETLRGQVKDALKTQKELHAIPVPEGAAPDFVFAALLPERKGTRRAR